MDNKNRSTWAAYGMESTFGTHPSTKHSYINQEGMSIPITKNWNAKYRGPFQMNRDVQNKYGLSNWEVFDPNKASKVYEIEVAERTKNMDNIMAMAENLGIEKGLVEYLTWQQGRLGAMDIITTAARTEGELKHVSKNTLKANSTRPLDGSSDYSYANDYLSMLKDKWDERKKGSEKYLPLTEEEKVFEGEIKF